MERLRATKDKAEFDQFMDERAKDARVARQASDVRDEAPASAARSDGPSGQG